MCGLLSEETSTVIANLRSAVSSPGVWEYSIVELDLPWSQQVRMLDAQTVDDYPGEADATRHARLSEDALVGLFGSSRLFGALTVAPEASTATGGGGRGELIAFSSVRSVGDGVIETDFTAVHRDHRRKGLAAALKAASVLAAWTDGHQEFRTGGSRRNEGIRAVNRRLGYVETERWITLRDPNVAVAD
ncbi:hypothetical protein AX769_04155 [Frondihabitans sp. PAMC 28766]|nr:hypothetical protein AX769_04155 [Frondihabitans sp. PAMC 28766]